MRKPYPNGSEGRPKEIAKQLYPLTYSNRCGPSDEAVKSEVPVRTSDRPRVLVRFAL